MSGAIITSYHAKVFLTGTLHAQRIKMIDEQDSLSRYALFFKKNF